jgi:hypothetical protein
MQAERNDTQTGEDRIAEIGELLSLGLMRLIARKSSQLSRNVGESLLDCDGQESGHFEPKERGRMTHGR